MRAVCSLAAQATKPQGPSCAPAVKNLKARKPESLKKQQPPASEFSAFRTSGLQNFP
jgi:hypothetical protein